MYLCIRPVHLVKIVHMIKDDDGGLMMTDNDDYDNEQDDDNDEIEDENEQVCCVIGLSVLVSAAAKGDLLLLERTLGGEHGEFSEEDISMALLRAACLGNATCVSRLLAHGADPDCEDLDGDTPLMLAATNNHIGAF